MTSFKKFAHGLMPVCGGGEVWLGSISKIQLSKRSLACKKLYRGGEVLLTSPCQHIQRILGETKQGNVSNFLSP